MRRSTAPSSISLSMAAVFPAFLFFAVMLVLGGLVYLLARETKGETLEDI